MHPDGVAATPAGPTAILMLGMHRSGTSVSTRVVSLLGADLGSGFLPPAADNPVGFWEHLGAHEIHERLLQALGREWHDVSEMPEGWLDHPATLVAIEELAALCRREFAESPLWAVKDPRMCRLVPVWLAALERLGVRATAAFVVRPPDEVAASLKTRDGWEEGHSHLMWVQHLLEAEQATRGIPRTMISYDRLMSDWRGAMQDTARDLQLQWPVAIADAAAKIDEFIDPSGFRHHRGRSGAEAAARSDFIANLVQACERIQAGSAGWEILQGFESTYACGADLFAWTISAHEEKLRVLRRDMQIWEADSRQARALLEIEKENHARIGSLESELGQKQAAAEELQARLEEANRRIEALEALLGASGSRIAELERGAAAAEAARELLNSQKIAVEDELSELRANALSRRWLLKRFLNRRILSASDRG